LKEQVTSYKEQENICDCNGWIRCPFFNYNSSFSRQWST